MVSALSPRGGSWPNGNQMVVGTITMVYDALSSFMKLHRKAKLSCASFLVNDFPTVKGKSPSIVEDLTRM